MRVLVTGNAGKIGRFVEARLLEAGCQVVGFDRADGGDVRDLAAVRRASRGCDAAVHLAAIPGDDIVPSEELMSINLLGTWNVLSAARGAGMQRVVLFSSVNALGVFLGHRAPDYLPLDDAHPSYARSPYGLSKRLTEEMCRGFTTDTGIATICLRPPGVLAPEDYPRMRECLAGDEEAEPSRSWEYGAFLDVRDAAEAARCALVCPDPGHVTLLLCAEDIAAAAPSAELVKRLLPGVEWRGGSEYEREPYRALVRIDRAKAVLGWRPRVRWRGAYASSSL